VLTPTAVVGAIDEFANNFSIPKAFIGLILLPIVGNAAGEGAGPMHPVWSY
jgi:Ca2+/H+ antiporter